MNSKRPSSAPPRVPTVDPGPPTTMSIRMWSAHRAFLERAAGLDHMGNPEWQLAYLLEAASRTLGEPVPNLPPIKRRPVERHEDEQKDDAITLLSAKVRTLETEIAELLRRPSRDRSISETRKVVGIGHR